VLYLRMEHKADYSPKFDAKDMVPINHGMVLRLRDHFTLVYPNGFLAVTTEYNLEKNCICWSCRFLRHKD